MSWISQTTFEILIDDHGDTTFRVTVRRGSSGECPPTEVMHDSHFPADALRMAARTAREELRKRNDAL